MSYVPRAQLRAVSDPTLRKFTITIDLTQRSIPYIFDSYTLYESFWNAITIRNLSGDDPIYYRQEDGIKYDVIPPNSERNIQGWGSLLQIQQEGTKGVNGTMIVSMVKAGDAAVGQ